MASQMSNDKAAKPQEKAVQQTSGSEEPPARPEEGTNLKRIFKDSVFCDLFRDRENALAAFLELHP